MKLNFWQWLGLIIFVIALILILRREAGESKKPAVPSAPAATQTAPDTSADSAPETAAPADPAPATAPAP